MKPGIYTVRGAIGPDKSEPVAVRVGPLSSDPSLMAYYSAAQRPTMGAWFTFRDVDCVYRPRPMSPHPERIRPERMPLDLQATAKSIAAAAFKAAKKAADEEADIARREVEQEGLTLDDITLAGIAGRTMGVAQ